MINKGRITLVGLTGGLGNQLFQLAAGLNAAKKTQLYLEWNLGKPRISDSGLPEVASFSLPKNTSLGIKKKDNGLASKAFGYMLRQGISTRLYERLPTFKIITKIFASLLISIYEKQLYWIYINKGVGYSQLPKYSNKKLLIGYFQSYMWLRDSEILNALKNLKIKNQTEQIVYYKNLANIEKPLVIHIRLGDYKNEDLFGIPTLRYYQNGINQLWESGKYSKIWIFSDEPELALKIYGKILPTECRWIPEINKSAAQTFEVMRYGRGYVIANSTFSWWAAMISHTISPEVIAPYPWFKSIESPQALIPPHWHLVLGWELPYK